MTGREYYNIYYQSHKLNRKPVTDKEKNAILACKVIRRYVNGEYQNIPVNQIRTVKCTIV